MSEEVIFEREIENYKKLMAIIVHASLDNYQRTGSLEGAYEFDTKEVLKCPQERESVLSGARELTRRILKFKDLVCPTFQDLLILDTRIAFSWTNEFTGFLKGFIEFSDANPNIKKDFIKDMSAGIGYFLVTQEELESDELLA